jgi:hypothetical protein
MFRYLKEKKWKEGSVGMGEACKSGRLMGEFESFPEKSEGF